MAAELLLILGDIFAAGEYTQRGSYVLETMAEPMARFPTAFGHALGAADLAVRGAIEVALAGEVGDERLQALARVVNGRYVPSLVLAGGSGEATQGITLFEGRTTGEPTAYVCRAYACDAPTSDPVELAAQLEALQPAAR
jgi:uncharacterized protein YyaL (SSP411 family)